MAGEQVIDLARLPLGRRTGLSDPRAGLTAQPDSKLGDAATFLRRVVLKPTDERVVNPLKPQASKPLGAFELAFDGKPIPPVGFTEAMARRFQTTQADRIARFRSATPVKLGSGPMSGWDWIRYGRRIRPADPGGVRGYVRQVGAHKERGTHAQHLEIPRKTLTRLATQASASDLPVPVSEAPVREATTPQLTYSIEDGATGVSDTFQWGYLLLAGVVAWLVLKRG